MPKDPGNLGGGSGGGTGGGTIQVNSSVFVLLILFSVAILLYSFILKTYS